ncbi:MAG: S8 family serine peptidase, partial [Candidatus Cloacimonadaceae bacterium]|nr:S8 family serine peptidase [Candidatus Cloacimonadaceae bacterium]
MDELGQALGIREVKQLFYSPAFKKDFESRHIAWGFHLWFEMRFDQGQDLRAMVMAFRGLDDIVAWAEPEYKKVLNADREAFIALDSSEALRWVPNDPRLGEQWHYNNTGQQNGTPGADIKLFPAWDIERGHPNVIVAVVDDGIQFNHPDLALNMWSGIGYNFVSGSSTVVPGNHGTHVAGTVAAVNNNNLGVAGVAGGNGTNRGATLMSCQVFTSSSSGGFHLAPVFAADNGAAISQNSWGYTNVGYYDQNVLDAIDYFNANGGGNVLNGGITIFATGNSNAQGQWYPGYYSGVFSVASTTNQDTRAYYSNYGTWVDVSAPGGETINVSARGVLSTLTGSTYGFYQGTSMACPHVSGLAALLISFAHRNGSNLSNTQIANILRDTTDDHYGVNPSFIGLLGTGRVNALTALNSIIPGMPSCQITSPVNNSVHDLGVIIPVQASASDSDGYITRVEFFVNDSPIPAHTDYSAPYTWNWQTAGLGGGSYVLRAVAFDDEGNQAQSQINVTLILPANEGFESGDFSAYAWQHAGNLPWYIQSTEKYSGIYAARSGAITHNQASTLSMQLDIST